MFSLLGNQECSLAEYRTWTTANQVCKTVNKQASGQLRMHKEQTGLYTADLVLRTLNTGFRKKQKG